MIENKRYGVKPTYNNIHWIVDESKIYEVTLFYCTDKLNAEIACNYLNSQEKHVVDLAKENYKIKTMIKEALHNERTKIGQSVLKQLLRNIGEEDEAL